MDHRFRLGHFDIEYQLPVSATHLRSPDKLEVKVNISSKDIQRLTPKRAL